MTQASSYLIGVNSAPTAVGRMPQWRGDRQTDKTMSFDMSLSSQENAVGATGRAADVVQAGAVASPLPSGPSAPLSDADLQPGRQAAAGLVLLQAQANSDLTAWKVADVDLSEVEPTGAVEIPADVVPAMSKAIPDAPSRRDGLIPLAEQQDDGGFARQDDASRGR